MTKVGMMLYGYCTGYFGSYSFCDKRIEAVGIDWIVARDGDGYLHFAYFDRPEEMDNMIAAWSKKDDDD